MFHAFGAPGDHVDPLRRALPSGIGRAGDYRGSRGSFQALRSNGAENRFKANFKQPIELNQNSSTFGLVIDVGESVNCLVDPPEFGASLRQFRWPITGRPPCRRFSEKNPELL
jgi:hypothetical protein